MFACRHEALLLELSLAVSCRVCDPHVKPASSAASGDFAAKAEQVMDVNELAEQAH